MLIADTLFLCIRNECGLDCLPVLKWRSISMKRYWKSRTPEQLAAFSKMRSEDRKRVMREQRIKRLSKYWHDPKRNANVSKAVSKRLKREWANMSEEEKKARIDNLQKGRRKFMEEHAHLPPEEHPCLKHLTSTKKKKLKDHVEIIEDVPRINDYCGVITESQMEELYGT